MLTDKGEELPVLGAKLILIVDDDPSFLASLKAVLESNGFNVVQAGSRSEGLDLFNEHNPDFVLCDIMMESIDSGIRLACDIRGKNGRVPLYLVSDIGRISAENIDLKKLGCNGAFQKPFDPDELIRVIRLELEEVR
jgi:sigma-B regulation protein RsbU (phosphoserine phosphatase)